MSIVRSPCGLLSVTYGTTIPETSPILPTSCTIFQESPQSCSLTFTFPDGRQRILRKFEPTAAGASSSGQ
jgi:hypothetical protein